MRKRAVFLDRDGTLNEEVGYSSSFQMIKIFPFSFEAVRKINSAGFLAIVATNQSGIGRGLISEEALTDLHKRISASFSRHKAHLDKFYYCPHYLFSSDPRYRKDCACRKPKYGMALRAAQDLNIDLKASYVIGDKVEDILFGLNINASSILVLTGYGEKTRASLNQLKVSPAHVAINILEAVNWILNRENLLREGS